MSPCRFCGFSEQKKKEKKKKKEEKKENIDKYLELVREEKNYETWDPLWYKLLLVPLERSEKVWNPAPHKEKKNRGIGNHN